MFKKIITYLLIMSVIIPIFTSAPMGFGISYGKASNPIYDENDNIIGYETTYKNKNGDTVVRREYEGAEGGTGTITEEYMDKDGTVHRRMGNYENDGEYSSINWSELRGELGDFKEYESRATESEYNKAVDEALEREQTGEVANPCAWGSRQTWSTCINYTINTFLYHVVFRVTNYITYLSGQLFNASIGFSLNGKTFDTDNNIMIAVGWQTIRDLVNMFFIFILLYIGISTILQYGNFGKAVLINVIVAAVLINFSMMITKVTIDASHVFAWEFYNRIDVVNNEEMGKGTTFTEIGSDIKVGRDFETKDLSAVFMAGFNPQRIMGKSSKSEAAYNDALKAALASGGGIGATWFQMNLIIILASIVNLVAAFILFAGTILFIVRIVVLWFVMILSPVAFVGMVSPNLKSYSKQWWDHLISQSFFAPAFLFMFALIVKMINSGFLESTIFAAKNSASLSILKIDPASTVIIFFNFLIIGGLMVGSLIIAKKMGGSGASAAIGWAHKGKDWMMGAAGAGARYGWWGAKGGARRWYAPMAENFATGKGFMGKVGNAARYIPFAGDAATRKAADMAVESRKIVEEKQKKYGKYTPDELKKMQGGWYNRTFRPYETAAMLQESVKKEDIKKLSPEDIEKSKDFLKSLGVKPKDIERQAPFLVKGKAEDTEREILLNEYKQENEAKYNEIKANLEKDYVNDPEGLGKAMAAAIKTELGGGFENFLNEKLSKAYSAENPEGFGKLDKKYAVKDKDYYEALSKELANYRAKAGVVKKASSSDMEKNAYNILTEPSLAKYLNSGSVNKIVEIGGDMMDRMLDGLTAMGKDYLEVSNKLEELGNYGLAKLLKGKGARGIKDMLEDYAVRKGRWKGQIIT